MYKYMTYALKYIRDTLLVGVKLSVLLCCKLLLFRIPPDGAIYELQLMIKVTTDDELPLISLFFLFTFCEFVLFSKRMM